MKEKTNKLVKSAKAVIYRNWSRNELQDLFGFVGLVWLFIGCWIASNIGVSFIVCGSIFFVMALLSSKAAK